MIDIWVLLGVMLELSALILLGLVLTKLHLLDEKGSAVLSTLVVHVFNPALIISSVCEGGLQTQGDTVIEAIICGVFLYALLILIAIVVYMRSKALKEEVSICKMIVIFSNTAFVGYPILRALYGDFAVFVFSLMHLPFNILIFTYGRSLLQKGNHQKMTVKDIFSIGTVSSIVALILYFGNISFLWNLGRCLCSSQHDRHRRLTGACFLEKCAEEQKYQYGRIPAAHRVADFDRMDHAAFADFDI